jgi:hypothetical protein
MGGATPNEAARACVRAQVSHHPPISAGHAENEAWVYDIVSAPSTKFLGNSVEIYPVGARTITPRTLTPQTKTKTPKINEKMKKKNPKPKTSSHIMHMLLAKWAALIGMLSAAFLRARTRRGCCSVLSRCCPIHPCMPACSVLLAVSTQGQGRAGGIVSVSFFSLFVFLLAPSF